MILVSKHEMPGRGEEPQTNAKSVCATSLRILAMVWMAVAFFPSHALNEHITKYLSPYQLYSWQDPQAGWNFAILPNSDREKTAAWVFDKRGVIRGVDELKLEISKLPKGSSILWLDRLNPGEIPKKKESERLEFPPMQIISDVRRFAEAHGIKLEIRLSLSARPLALRRDGVSGGRRP